MSDPFPSIPLWQSHKIVEADRITEVIRLDVPGMADTWLTRWRLACGVVVDVSRDLNRRVPELTAADAGYYVRYEDGYESWSPAKAFEEGYTRCSAPP